MLRKNLAFGPEGSALQMISMFTWGAWQPARPELLARTFLKRVRVRVRPSSRGESKLYHLSTQTWLVKAVEAGDAD